jgi:hypothetical protein
MSERVKHVFEVSSAFIAAKRPSKVESSRRIGIVVMHRLGEVVVPRSERGESACFCWQHTGKESFLL